jgi:hypothetical protein
MKYEQAVKMFKFILPRFRNSIDLLIGTFANNEAKEMLKEAV